MLKSDALRSFLSRFPSVAFFFMLDATDSESSRSTIILDYACNYATVFVFSPGVLLERTESGGIPMVFSARRGDVDDVQTGLPRQVSPPYRV